MYVITSDGKKLPVDDAEIGYNSDYAPMITSVALVANDIMLTRFWVLSLCRYGFPHHKHDPAEVIKEIEYDHYPTHEEMLYAISQHDLGPYDHVSVSECWRYGRD
jgi:hypothetical protein